MKLISIFTLKSILLLLLSPFWKTHHLNLQLRHLILYVLTLFLALLELVVVVLPVFVILLFFVVRLLQLFDLGRQLLFM